MKSKLTKLMAMCLAVLMVVSLVPSVTFASGEDAHSHPVCGAIHNEIADHTGECEELVWTVWDGSDMDADTDGIQLTEGNWYLEDDLEYADVINVTGNVNFCFNGKFIEGTGTSDVFKIDNGNTLNICDCSDDERKFSVNENGLWVLDDENGTETLIGGGITGTDTEYGTVIYVVDGTLNMYGGNIVGNRAQGEHDDSGIVNAEYDGTLRIYGGNICGNQSSIIVRSAAYYSYFYGGNIINNKVGNIAASFSNYLKFGGDIEIYNNVRDDGKPFDLSAWYAIIDEDLTTTNTISLRSGTTIRHINNDDISGYLDIFTTSNENHFISIGSNNTRINCEKYKITTQPSKDNNYTVGVNYETNANYSWYKTTATPLSPELGTANADSSYNEETGLWYYSGTDSSPYSYTILKDVYLKKGDVIVFDFIDDNPGVDICFEESDGFYNVIYEGNPYVYEAYTSDLYHIYFRSAYNKPEFSAKILKSTELLEDQTSNMLDTAELNSGYYFPEVRWDHGTADTSDDYTLKGDYVLYCTDEISGDVSISGKTVVGKTIKATYTGVEDITYQWYRNDIAIDNATTRLYTITEDDLDAIIKVKVSGAGDYSGEVFAETSAILAEDPNPDEPDSPEEIAKPKSFVIESTDVNDIANTFKYYADVTTDGDTIKIKLTRDIWGEIYLKDGDGNFLIDLNGKSIRSDFFDYTIHDSSRFDGTLTITGSGTIYCGYISTIRIYGNDIKFAVEDGKDYFTAVNNYGGNIFSAKNTETQTTRYSPYSITIEQKIFTDYTVKFNRNGGYGYMSDQIINVGEATALNTNTFTKYGKTFTGWATSADGEVVYANDEVVTDIIARGQTITLYAVWEEIPVTTYTITFDANGGSGTMADATDISGDYTLPENGFVAPDGKQFKAWSVNGTEYEVGDTITVNNNTTVTAVWEEIPNTDTDTYTVTFDAYGGTVEPESALTDSNGKLATLPTPVRSNTYVFDGWYTAPNGGTKITADTVFTSDTTIYAKWEYIGGGGGGTSAVTNVYTVTFNTDGGSKIIAQKVNKNATATVPTEPTKDGLEFDGWYTDKAFTNIYDFSSQVTKNITLYAKWTQTEPEVVEPEVTDPEVVEPETVISFTDVNANDWFYKDVLYVAENKLMNGISETEFAPDATLTRAMLVTILYRNAGEPATNRSIPFADVDMGAWYANAVIWAKQNSIVTGITENEFAPNDNITREQIATILFRYAQLKGMNLVTLEENLHFTDSNEISEYAISAMNWAVGAGLINGKSETTLAPKDFATRSEMAAILNRFVELNK